MLIKVLEYRLWSTGCKHTIVWFWCGATIKMRVFTIIPKKFAGPTPYSKFLLKLQHECSAIAYSEINYCQC